MESTVRARAKNYAAKRNLALDDALLGCGLDGVLWSTHKLSVVKAFYRFENYQRELACYIRLHEHRVAHVGKFSIPELLGFCNESQAIEIGLVEPPYILDFGKCYLDLRPDYPPEVWEEVDQNLSDDFGEEGVSEIKNAFWDLEQIGIYYIDPNRGNIAL